MSTCSRALLTGLFVLLLLGWPPRSDLAALPALDPEIASLLDDIDADRVSTTIETLANFVTRNSCSDNSGSVSGIGAARDWIADQFAAIAADSDPDLQVVLDPFNGCQPNLQNVLAIKPGIGHPDRIIVIGGHYDSRTLNGRDGASPAPGANDSGSQTAAVLEAARVLAGHSFDATIVFAAWAGEEQGLVGSRAFVSHYTDYFPTGTLELNLNCDIIGGDNTVNEETDLQHFRLFSPGTPREVSAGDGTTDDTSPSRGLMRYVGRWGGSYVPDFIMLPQLREDRVGRGGDHKSFIAAGIPGVRFIEVNENLAHQHSANDLFQFVTPAYTARVARVMIATLASLARASTAPQDMSAVWTDDDTVSLAWDAPAAGPDVDHYLISARPVTENFYHAGFIVPGWATNSDGRGFPPRFRADARVIEDLGLDPGVEYFVSVAAVDADGHESLYAYPEYRCGSGECVVPPEALDITATR